MKKLVLLLFSIFSTISFAQVGIGTTAPAAAFEVVSGTNGVLIPRVTLANKFTSSPIVNPVGGGDPANGTLVFNTLPAGSGSDAVVPGFYFWNTPTSRWVFVGNDTTIGNVSGAWMTTGNSGTTPGTTPGTTLLAQQTMLIWLSEEIALQQVELAPQIPH